MLFVLEGLDGVGKTTQTKLLMEYFGKQGYTCSFVHFPRIEIAPFGPLIQKYLQGDFGPLESISPYFSATLYATDQYLSFRDDWDNSQESLIFLDRYYYSNLAYQSMRMPSTQQKEFQLWLESVIENFGMPEPDLALYLHASSDFQRENLSKRDTQDLHEQDGNYQHQVHHKYLQICEEKWKKLCAYNCSDSKGSVKSISDIHTDLVAMITQVLS